MWEIILLELAETIKLVLKELGINLALDRMQSAKEGYSVII
jgi:hypothetical protein